MNRFDECRDAFSRIYSRDAWGLGTEEYVADKPGWEPDSSRRKRLEDLIGTLMELNDVRSVAEFGCGYLSFPKSLFGGVHYTGYDVVPEIIADNRSKHSDANMSFELLRDGLLMPPADMLISKDVLQHLPTVDVQYYLSVFRTNFRFMLIGNDCLPDDNLNGDTKRGGYRTLRLERPPFNYPNVVLQRWKCLEFGTFIVKNFCLFQGEPGKGSRDGVILRGT